MHTGMLSVAQYFNVSIAYLEVSEVGYGKFWFVVWELYVHYTTDEAMVRSRAQGGMSLHKLGNRIVLMKLNCPKEISDELIET
jgi:hypothetical protein